jgi:hypothetical protein
MSARNGFCSGHFSLFVPLWTLFEKLVQRFPSIQTVWPDSGMPMLLDRLEECGTNKFGSLIKPFTVINSQINS